MQILKSFSPNPAIKSQLARIRLKPAQGLGLVALPVPRRDQGHFHEGTAKMKAKLRGRKLKLREGRRKVKLRGRSE